MRDDPGIWWRVRWYTHKINWVGLVLLVAGLVFMVWRVIYAWRFQ